VQLFLENLKTLRIKKFKGSQGNLRMPKLREVRVWEKLRLFVLSEKIFIFPATVCVMISRTW